MLSKKIEASLNSQVQLEAESSQLYLSMASWAETQGMNGVCAFLYHHSDEERMHALKLTKFINERGGHGLVPALKAPAKHSNPLRLFLNRSSHTRSLSPQKSISWLMNV